MPRCRTAKVGRNIKVPSEMKYADFKAVYLEKKVSLEEWKNSRRVAGKSKFPASRPANKVEQPPKERSEKIKTALQSAMVANNIKGNLEYPPPQLDMSGYKFDAEHTQGDIHPHDVTEEEARQFISDAYFAIVKYGGNSYNYYGKEGAAFVRTDLKTIRTAFKASEYDAKIKSLIEVYENELNA